MDEPAAGVGHQFSLFEAERASVALSHAEACAALNRKLADLIPADARTELGVVRVEHDCLVIAAASGSRAAQARRLSGELIRAAGQLWPSPIRRSRIFVKPGLNLGGE